MSKNIEEIKQTDSFSKDNLPKGEINPDFSGTNHKIFYDPKKILLISLLIFLLQLSLFFVLIYYYHKNQNHLQI